MGSQIQTKDGNYSKFLKTYLQPIPRTLPSVALVRERLFKIIREFVMDENLPLKEGHHLKNDLGLDSLDMVEVIMMCEKDFFTNLPDREWTKSETVLDLERLIFKSLKR